MPRTKDLPLPTENLLPVTLICDNIRDPGNVGTILRSAAAAGCKRIIFMKGKLIIVFTMG